MLKTREEMAGFVWFFRNFASKLVVYEKVLQNIVGVIERIAFVCLMADLGLSFFGFYWFCPLIVVGRSSGKW